MRFIIISDYFLDEVVGGAEINDHELQNILKQNNSEVFKIKSQDVTVHMLEENRDSFFIVSNFINLAENVKAAMVALKYIIYEHDHKYLRHRNPSAYNNFTAPAHHIINDDFYRQARAVLCQSQFHLDIIAKNLNISNLISLGGNLWSLEALEKIQKINTKPKKDSCSIMNSTTSHKNTRGAIEYCIANNLKYELISGMPYHNFLEEMGKNKRLVFFPQTPETLSRIVVEARMMGMSVITNKLVGAVYEDWFNLKGEPLISKMVDKRNEVFEKIMGVLI